MHPETITTITFPLMQLINVIGNIIIFLLAIYVKWEITKLENKIIYDDRRIEEKILTVVNSKYVKSDVYAEKHKNIIEKIVELRNNQKELISVITKSIENMESKFKLLDAKNKEVDKKLILLSTIPCPFHEQKKFLLDQDKD
jgi:hypothetical protein